MVPNDHHSDEASYAGLTEEQKTMGLALAGIGVIEVDYDRNEVRLDDLAAAVFGVAPYTPIDRATFHARIHPEDWPSVEREVIRLLDPDFDDIIDVTHRTIDMSGSTRWVRARKRLYRDETDRDRRARTATAAIQDVTREVQARERSDFLLRELSHRTKNLAALTSVIAQQTMQTCPPEEFLERFVPRVATLADSQDLVGGSQATSIVTRIASAIEPFDTGSGAFRITGDDFVIDENAAQAVGLAMHELSTNASKYGALSRLGGEVRVDVQHSDSGWSLVWQEVGGPPVIPPTREGFGSRILTRYVAMATGGKGTVTFAPGGLHYAMHVPAKA